MRKYANQSNSQRNHPVSKERDPNKLRTPYGYSETMMIELEDTNTDASFDTESVSSLQGVGRGHSLSHSNFNQSRGVRGLYRRGYRGRYML